MHIKDLTKLAVLFMLAKDLADFQACVTTVIDLTQGQMLDSWTPLQFDM